MPSHTAYELVLAAFCANLPFGAYRSTARRLTWRWLLAIHLPIPAVFLLRTAAGYSYSFIPWLFIGAVSGQLLGGQLLAAWRRRRGTADAEPFDGQPGDGDGHASCAVAVASDEERTETEAVPDL